MSHRSGQPSTPHPGLFPPRLTGHQQARAVPHTHHHTGTRLLWATCRYHLYHGGQTSGQMFTLVTEKGDKKEEPPSLWPLNLSASGALPPCSLQASGPADAGGPPAPHTTAFRQEEARSRGLRRAHPAAHSPTCEPVGPAEPEAECVQRQGVDEVHQQMDQALHGDHQEPELRPRQCSGPLRRGQSHAHAQSSPVSPGPQ